MKRCEPFYIGAINIYDYQATGFYRWNTFCAALGVSIRFMLRQTVSPNLPPAAQWPFPTGKKP